MTVNKDDFSCWKRRSSLEKWLMFMSSFLVLAVIGLIVGIIIVSEQEKDKDGEKDKNGEKEEETSEVCYTQGCVNAANNVLSNMNLEINPCEDFYEFACGKFLKETIIPDDKASVSSFTAISDDLEIKLRTIIEELKSGEGANHALLVKQLYDSCKNEELIEQSNLDEIKRVLKEIGGWPVLEGDWKSMEWHEYTKKLRQLGYSTSYILSFGVDVDWKNTARHMMQIDQPSLGISREFLIDGDNNANVKAYRQYMVDVAEIFGVPKNVNETELMRALKFEMDLANISLSREERRDYNRMYNPMKISSIQTEYNNIVPQWKEYFKDVLNVPEIILGDETVNVNVPTYFTKLQELLKNTNSRVVANYIVWRLLKDSVPYLNKELRDAELKFNSVMLGVKEKQKRWKECIAVTTDQLPIAVGSLYVKKHFKEEARTNSKTMVQNIRNEFQEILKNIDWMDDDTRNKALDKAIKMSTHIAYPDELTNDAKLAEYYADLNFESENYLKMMLQRNVFAVSKAYKDLNKPVDKDDWVHHASAAVVNAYYNFLFNSIEFPAGILQGVFFNNDRPRYMNYGAIGFVIGHEITHGFDDQGRQFNKNGDLEQWWNQNTENSFKEKAKCIVDQYSNYKVDEIDMNLNGINTQGENIADNGGIKESYLAYKKMIQQSEPEKRLPGLQKYSPEQMFWISAANVWCIKYTKEDLIQRVKTGVHSPGRFRVIGPMSNLKEFSNDFQCPVGSKMNPKEKCVVW